MMVISILLQSLVMVLFFVILSVGIRVLVEKKNKGQEG